MSDIDFESLHNAVMENIDERLWNIMTLILF